MKMPQSRKLKHEETTKYETVYRIARALHEQTEYENEPKWVSFRFVACFFNESGHRTQEGSPYQTGSQLKGLAMIVSRSYSYTKLLYGENEANKIWEHIRDQNGEKCGDRTDTVFKEFADIEM